MNREATSSRTRAIVIVNDNGGVMALTFAAVASGGTEPAPLSAPALVRRIKKEVGRFGQHPRELTS